MHHKTIMKLVGFQQQMRILHWQTKKYARHIAYGSIYDSLDDLIDKLAEVSMGKYGRIDLSGDLGDVTLKNMDEISINSFVDEFVKFLTGLNKEFDASVDTDLLNIRDEILGEINKLKYLLTLS